MRDTHFKALVRARVAQDGTWIHGLQRTGFAEGSGTKPASPHGTRLWAGGRYCVPAFSTARVGLFNVRSA